MVAIGLLLGHETVMEAFADRDLQEFVERMVSCEVIPEIEDDPTELETFAKSILLRFDNPFIRHMLKSIALNSLSKWEARNFPTVRDRWHRLGSLADFEIFTFAAMLYLYSPESEFTPDDNALHLDKIRKIFASWLDDCRRIVREITRSGIFLEDFDQSVAGFSDKAGDYLKLIKEVSMKNALESFLEAIQKTLAMNEMIRINKADNVGIVIGELLKKGECFDGIVALTDIPKRPQDGLSDIPEGSRVIKYGFPIGHASAPIRKGEWVHSHNLSTSLGDDLKYEYHPKAKAPALKAEKDCPLIEGYVRKDGSPGIRNELWIIPTVGCVNGQARSHR